MATSRKKNATGKKKLTPKQVTISKAIKTGQPWLINLINDIFWLMALMVTLYTFLALASFNMNDPAWSRGNGQTVVPINLAGLTGAYLADIGYYIFGYSIWWGIFAAAITLYHSFRPLNARSLNTGAEGKDYNVWLTLTGLIIMLLFSPVLENLDNHLANFCNFFSA